METWEEFSRLRVFPGKYRQPRMTGDESPPPPPTDKFFISIRIDCLVHEYFPDYYTKHMEHSERGSFELHRNTLLLSDNNSISRILSSVGISTDYHPQMVPQIIFQAQMAMISSTSYYCNNIYDVPWLTVVALFRKVIRPPNDDDDDDDEEEEIRRATEESLMDMMDIDTFKTGGPASRSSIEALEKARFVQGLDYSSVLEVEEQCMICLEKLIINSSSPPAVLKYEVEQVTRMPCSHLYHADCIVRWLETSHLCPVCRFQMPTTT